MELVTYQIPRKKGDRSPISIIPIGDIQYTGKKGVTAIDTLKRTVEVGQQLGAWYLGMGDYLDCFSPSNRQRMRGAALYDCVTEDVQALTRNGWKYHHELLIGEELLGYDLNLKCCRWTKLKDISVWHYAPTVAMNAKNWDWVVTDNHKWVAETSDGVQRLTPTYALRQSRHKVLVSSPCAEDGESNLSDDEARVIGWLLGDGHVKFPECWTSFICQTKHPYVEEIRALLQRVGLTVAETLNQPGRTSFQNAKPWVRFGLSAPEIRRLFDRLGVVEDAALPKIASRLSRSARTAMLEAFHHAEGYRDGSGWTFSQNPGPRLDLYLALAALCGRRTRKGWGNSGDHCIKTGVTNKPYMWPQGEAWSRRLEYAHELKTVWCPVTETHTWVARRGTQVSITGNTAEDIIEDAGLWLTQELYRDILKPTEGRWLGLLEGHHYMQLKTGKTTDQHLCELLKARFLGTSAMIRLQFNWNNGARNNVVLWAHHGAGGGAKACAPLNKLENISPYWGGVDVFLMSHTTKSPVVPINRIEARWGGNGAPDLVHRKIYFVSTGGFSRSYALGSKDGSVPRGGYAEQRMLPPSVLGAPIIRIVPRNRRQRREDGKDSSVWSPEISVEV